MTKTSAIWQHAAKTPTNLLLLAAKQEPYKKSLSLNEKYWSIFWKKKFRRKGQQAELDRKGNRTRQRAREEIAKWNQMTALRFQTGGRHQTSPASLWGKGKCKCHWHFCCTGQLSYTKCKPWKIELDSQCTIFCVLGWGMNAFMLM